MACCGGFTCSKNSLISLNLLYMVIAFVLIGVSAYAKIMDYLNSFAILGGIIGCGVFLLLIGVMGLYGAAKHHQICLFFYMVILFLLFVVQFSLAVAMLAIAQTTRSALIKVAWDHSSNATRQDVENQLCCCGFEDSAEDLQCQQRLANVNGCGDCKSSGGQASSTASSSGRRGSPVSNGCKSCKEKLEGFATSAVTTTGGVGLFFSFTEIMGVVITYRYRGQRDVLTKSRPFL